MQRLWVVLVMGGVLAGCSALTQAPAEVGERETIKGELSAFATQANKRITHRLSEDGRLVAYLASTGVDLAEYEGQDVELLGRTRADAIQDVFWVEAVESFAEGANGDPKNEQAETETVDDEDVASEEENEEGEETQTEQDEGVKSYRGEWAQFDHPAEWTYVVSPSGEVLFLAGGAGAQAFMTYNVQSDYTLEPAPSTRVLYGQLAGRKIETDSTVAVELRESESGRVHRLVLSDLGQRGTFDRVLRSLQLSVAEPEEEEEAVVTEDDEAETTLSEQDAEDAAETETEEDEADSGTEETDEESDTDDSATESDEVALNGGGLDRPVRFGEGSSFYTSSYYGFSAQIPVGYWYRNFGPLGGDVTRMGLSDVTNLEVPSDALAWVTIQKSDNPVTARESRVVGARYEVLLPRDDQSQFVVMAPVGKEVLVDGLADNIKRVE